VILLKPDASDGSFTMEMNGAWGQKAHKFVDGQLVEWNMKYSENM
jgi:hypothetical protein